MSRPRREDMSGISFRKTGFVTALPLREQKACEKMSFETIILRFRASIRTETSPATHPERATSDLPPHGRIHNFRKSAQPKESKVIP
jgi:hypothetical protein